DDFVALLLEERDVDVRVLAALFRQNLDADIVVFVRGETCVIAIHLPVQDDGRGAGRLRVSGHLELVLRYRLEFVAGVGGRRIKSDHYKSKEDRGEKAS